MSDGPKRFSLSDYQSKRGATKPAETPLSLHPTQKSELEELHMLLGTGLPAPGLSASAPIDASVLRTPGASPDNGDGQAASRRRGRKSRGRRGRSRSRSPARKRRARSSSSGSSGSSSSRSASRSPSRSPGRRRRARGGREPSESSGGRGKISMRCVFPYEDGGIIIGLRGAHLTKLRGSVPDVDWRISNETDDKQDRILVVRGTVKNIAQAFKALAEHFLSQGVHIDYPQQSHVRGSNNVDTSKPLVPIRLLLPHKTCGAIIGQRSETLINTRIQCSARRVYVYRERISSSRERVVEIVGTPQAVSRVLEVLGEQVARTLTADQAESKAYEPERDGLRRGRSRSYSRSRSRDSRRRRSSRKSSRRSHERSRGSRRHRSYSRSSSDSSASTSRSRSRSSSRSRSRSRSRRRRTRGRREHDESRRRRRSRRDKDRKQGGKSDGEDGDVVMASEPAADANGRSGLGDGLDPRGDYGLDTAGDTAGSVRQQTAACANGRCDLVIA
ncbi:RNA binding protein, heterogenous nuclear RNP-K like protein [Coemansia interrupta]|uniref:RNA binding protein, heterogenous nuclear RNP-K like protein n=1 Tax=Coemansia interrupta TaxID=1126814 RepID=A0A9W8H6D8_9FUNG|nr:RNA binding protein, heterogenous nuclear RNP-K like protein [Coemansia interrupta]